MTFLKRDGFSIERLIKDDEAIGGRVREGFAKGDVAVEIGVVFIDRSGDGDGLTEVDPIGGDEKVAPLDVVSSAAGEPDGGARVGAGIVEFDTRGGLVPIEVGIDEEEDLGVGEVDFSDESVGGVGLDEDA